VQTNCTKGTSNYGCYTNPTLDKTLTDALASNDPSGAYATIDDLVSKDEPLVPMVERSAVTISSARLKGFRWFNFADNADIANVSVN
jgi:peptide/nickel transport system substrate-binding protein